MMKQANKLRNRLLSPLVYLGALILLLEDWLWDFGTRLAAFIATWPPLRALERRIMALGPYPALCVFVLPALLLFPVKVAALMAIAAGHALYGAAVIVAAKVAGAAVVARLYALTRPALLTLAWFARWHDAFVETKERWVAHLKNSAAFRRASALGAQLRAAARALTARWRRNSPMGERHGTRPARMLRRFIAIWRARHR
jgi:hypothetical protein